MTGLYQHGLLLLACSTCGAAAVFDLRQGLIPNWLVTVLAVFSVSLHLLASLLLDARGWLGTLLFVVIGALVCGIVPALLYALKSLGGGDLKLLVAVGACLGPQVGFELQAYAYAIGAVYALVQVVARGTLWKTFVGSSAGLLNPVLPSRLRQPVPPEALATMHFAPAVCAAACLVTARYWGVSP
ncbi:MAG: A24 family peptidase [Polyangiales bacterium]